LPQEEDVPHVEFEADVWRSKYPSTAAVTVPAAAATMGRLLLASMPANPPIPKSVPVC